MSYGVWDQHQALEVHLKQNTPRGLHGDKGRRRTGKWLAKSQFCWSKPAVGTLTKNVSWISPLQICSFFSTVLFHVCFQDSWWVLYPWFTQWLQLLLIGIGWSWCKLSTCEGYFKLHSWKKKPFHANWRVAPSSARNANASNLQCVEKRAIPCRPAFLLT